jgi:hypothetical protein
MTKEDAARHNINRQPDHADQLGNYGAVDPDFIGVELDPVPPLEDGWK